MLRQVLELKMGSSAKKTGYTRVIAAKTRVYPQNTRVNLLLGPKTAVETVKMGVNQALSQQLLDRGVEPGER